MPAAGRRSLPWLVILVLHGSAAMAQTTTRVSVDGAGNEGNGHSFVASVSHSGRFVAFQSSASTLVAGDTNGQDDVFVRDRQLGTTTRVSVGSGGVQGNGASSFPSISADGRYVAFHSSANNLVAGDGNGAADVFVHDRQLGTIARVSVSSAGAEGNGASNNAAVSGDGRYVVFNSLATTLVAGDVNGVRDVYLHDRIAATTIRVGASSGGNQNLDGQFLPAISSDGRFVAFQSGAVDLVSGDTNLVQDVFLFDRTSAAIVRVSVNDAGVQGNAASYNPALSSDGRFVAFDSLAGNLVAGDTNNVVDVFVRDVQSGTTARVSVRTGGMQATGFSGNANNPSISADGRLVAFGSLSSSLVAGDANGVFDRFLHDRQTGATVFVSVNDAGVQSNIEGGSTGSPRVSGDGSVVAFDSFATNLVPADGNASADIFVRLIGGATHRIFDSGFESGE